MSWTCGERIADEQTDDSFNLFAYRRGADATEEALQRRRLPLARLEQTVRWAVRNGMDTIVIDLVDGEPCFPDHHVCSDPNCPGGC